MCPRMSDVHLADCRANSWRHIQHIYKCEHLLDGLLAGTLVFSGHCHAYAVLWQRRKTRQYPHASVFVQTNAAIELAFMCLMAFIAIIVSEATPMRKFTPNERADERARAAAVANARTGLMVGALSLGMLTQGTGGRASAHQLLIFKLYPCCSLMYDSRGCRQRIEDK